MINPDLVEKGLLSGKTVIAGSRAYKQLIKMFPEWEYSIEKVSMLPKNVYRIIKKKEEK